MEESPPFKYEIQHCSPELIASISNVLDIAGIPSVLWGEIAMALHGIPFDIYEIEFVIPDEDLDRAYHILLERGFRACSNGKECYDDPESTPPCPRSHPPAARHLHLHDSDPKSLLLHRKSEMLWAVPSFEALPTKENPATKIVLASDKDAVSPSDVSDHTYPDSLPPVRVPSWHCLLEAYVLLIEREDDEDELTATYAGDWYVLVSFLRSYQRSTQPLELEYIDPRCRRFCRAIWLAQETDCSVNIKEELDAFKQVMKESREGM